jgi:hypothetical protein
MTSIAHAEMAPPRRSTLLWLAPLQAAAVFTVVAIASGAQTLRAWLCTALVWLLGLPLLVSLQAGLFAMMLFEPLRGVIRRAQYLFVDYSSEDPIHVITPIVTVIAFAMLVKTQRLTIFRASPLASWVSLLGLIYVVEILNPLQGGILVGVSGAMFVLVPLLWFYFGQAANERFMRNALGLIVVLGLLTSLYGIYQLVFGYPSFEQYWIDNTEFYNSIAVGNIERALATFSSAEEWGRYTEIGAIVAFGFAAGSKKWGARGGWFAAGVLLTGFVALTGQRAAVFGLAAGLVVLVVLGARSFPRALARVALLLVPVVLFAVFIRAPDEEDMLKHDDDQTVATVLSHTERGVLKPAKEESFQIRLKNWAYLVTDIIPYRPLGAGVGAGSLSESRFSDSYDLPPIDSSIFRNAIAVGIPGVLLFIWILMRATWFSWRSARRPTTDDENAHLKRIVSAMFVAIVLNSIFGMTFTLYSVAPIAWLLIGWISSQAATSNRHSEREVITI